MPASQLGVELDLPREAIAGHLVVARLTVRNDDASALTVSGRLRLGEGDVGLVVRDPSDRQRRLQGRYEVDAPPRPVDLEPGAVLATGLDLQATDGGRVTEQPGIYRVGAVYHPSVHEPPESSPARELMVRTSREEAQRRVADLLDPAVVGDALALGHVEPGSQAEAALAEVADLAAGAVTGIVAALVLAAAEARRGSDARLRALLDGLDPAEVGWLATAVLPPAADPGDPFLAGCVERCARAREPAAEQARRMLLGEPFRAAG